jgi:large subunit ribosomal protein L3
VIDGLLGRKLGMVQAFDKEGRLRGATVIEAGPCLVTQIRTVDRDGYAAVQLGFGGAKRTNKPMRGHLKQQGDLRFLREFRVDNPTEHRVGERVGAELFEEGDRVDVTGISKGRGFAGGVKRYGFRGGPRTHGQSDRHRAPGAIGAGNTPGRTFKGMRMAGHMGAERVTVRGLEVLQSDPARGLILVAGGVPGAPNGLVQIRYSAKTREVARKREPKPAEAAPPAAEEEETPEAVEEQAPRGSAAEATEAVEEDAAPEASAEESSAGEAEAGEAAEAESDGGEPQAEPSEDEQQS